MANISHDSETPTEGQQVITACAFIHKNFDGIEKVFLPKRAATKKFLPGIFELPGGHIDFGEKLIEGLKREILEEFQIEINIGDPFFTFTYENKVKGSHSVEIIFFATFGEPIENIKLNPEDHSEHGWFSESDLGKIINEIKKEDDPEILAIKKGFSLLKGNTLNFATR